MASRSMEKARPLGIIFHNQDRVPLLSGNMSHAQLWGLAHLVLIIFIASNCREIIANILKYGLVIQWLPKIADLRSNLKLLCGTLIILFLTGLGFYIEWERGRDFQKTWRQKMVEMHMLELKLELRSNSHNIYRLVKDFEKAGVKPPVPKPKAKMITCGGFDESDSEVPDLRRKASLVIDESRPFNVIKVLNPWLKSQIEDFSNEAAQLISSPIVHICNALGKKITEEQIENLHLTKCVGIVLLMIFSPTVIILNSQFDPLGALFLLMLGMTWGLKLISFFHVLRDLRDVIINDTENFRTIIPFNDERASCLQYPRSLTLSHFITYLIAPTLCFQFNYPRKPNRDKKKILRSAVQLSFSLILMKIIFEQYMTKILENTFEVGSLDSLPSFLGHMFERLLKLSVPTLYCWLLMFLSFFHFWFILLSEIVRFQDQCFYKDWWNSAGFSEYWRKWNLPVHHFCTRHIYRPLLNQGLTRPMASQVVFMLSALCHELIIAGSLKLGWTGLVFLAFMAQTPLSALTDSAYMRRRPMVGNTIFWVTFCITGQPMGVLVFYYLWNIKSRSLTLPAFTMQ